MQHRSILQVFSLNRIPARQVRRLLAVSFAIAFALLSEVVWADSQQPAARRIVSMAPNITETIFALGCGNRLVGVTDFCTYPPQAKRLPRVGGYFNPNLEKLTALRPDLVIVQGRHEKVDKFCREKGIPIFHVQMDSLSSIYDGILRLGSILDCKQKAQELSSAIRGKLGRIRKDIAGCPHKKVFICLGRAPGSMTNIYTAGGASFISELLHIAGGDNIFGDVTLPYPEASSESLIKRAPEVIIEMRPGQKIAEGRRKEIVAEWNVFNTIPAVANHRVYVLTEDFLLIPGPRVAAAAWCLARIVHGKGPAGSSHVEYSAACGD